MSNILPKDSSEVSYIQKLIVSKKFDNFAKITLGVTETGPSRITPLSLSHLLNLCLPYTECLQLNVLIPSSPHHIYHNGTYDAPHLLVTDILCTVVILFCLGKGRNMNETKRHDWGFHVAGNFTDV